MTEWQFASKEGLLIWTSPSLPDATGPQLFTVLSPTLLLGYQQQNESLPVDYVKLSSVKSAVTKSPKAIELERSTGAPLLLVARTEMEANDWLHMIRLALQQSEGSSRHDNRTPTPPPRPVDPYVQPAANAPPPAAPVQTAPALEQRPITSFTQPLPQQPQQPQQQPPAQQPEQVVPQRPENVSGQDLWLRSSYAKFADLTAARGDRTLQGADQRSVPDSAPVGSPQATPPVHIHSKLPSATGAQTAAVAAEPCSHDASGQHQYRPFAEIIGQQQTTTQTGNAFTTTVATHEQLVNPTGPAPTGIPSVAPADNRPMPSAFYEAMRTAVQSSDVGERPQGSRSLRSGMIINLPSSQAFNRNTAPNLSAMWKEWTGPDGALYVFHEPTKTLQRKLPGSDEFETLVEGSETLTPQDLNARPYSEGETTVNLNTETIRNVGAYGVPDPNAPIPAAPQTMTSPNVYRSELVASPRGQYSPTRRAHVDALAQPRVNNSGYHGRRVHRVTLAADEIEHQVQTLGSQGLMWDPTTGEAYATNGANQGEVGPSTLQKQWEHVRSILMQGRYFKKHALRSNVSSFRFVFLTSDNAYVCCVPTSVVMLNVNKDAQTFGSVTETIQYYGPESRAIAVNTITHISLGIDENFVLRRRGLTPENVFCIVSKTHAFVLECGSADEAKYFCDAWTFFLYHSKPINLKKERLPNVVAPVTHGTRTGVAF